MRTLTVVSALALAVRGQAKGSLKGAVVGGSVGGSIPARWSHSRVNALWSAPSREAWLVELVGRAVLAEH